MKSHFTHKSGHFKGSVDSKGKGIDLYYQSWTPKNPRAVLIFIHGMAEHSGRYQFPVDYFTQKNFTVYAMDLRGHGQSGGRKAFAESLDHLIHDIKIFVEKVRALEPKKKVFLIGHSFGGQLVLNYGASFPEGLAGIIVSSPNIKLQLTVPFLKRLIAPLVSFLIPHMTFGNEVDPNMVSRNKHVVAAYKRDEHIQRRITARLGDIVLSNQLYLMDIAKKFRVPSFIMHAGSDQICSPKGAIDFFENIPIQDKTLKIYEGFYHELFNEEEREDVFSDMEAWIEKKI